MVGGDQLRLTKTLYLDESFRNANLLQQLPGCVCPIGGQYLVVLDCSKAIGMPLNIDFLNIRAANVQYLVRQQLLLFRTNDVTV